MFSRRLGRLPWYGCTRVTATAHKLARVVYHVLSTREAYNESIFIQFDQVAAERAEARLRNQAAKLGFQITLIDSVA